LPFGSAPLGCWTSLAAVPRAGIRKTRNGESFGTYGQTVL
jgi:hypothetical protein